ncbi:MAG TPA: penicillin-binding protein 2 [Phycisphaerae bacterium]|nr:penicillin-binding protein 2 [Phycisphaerae bacterium]
MDALRSRRSNLAGQALIALVLVALVGLAGRLVYINSYQGSALLARAERQQRSTIPLKHRRGLIVDCCGRLISGTMLQKSVFADPKVIPDKAIAAQKVSEILGIPAEEIAPDLLSAEEERFFVIRRGVSEDQARRISEEGLYGLGVFDEPYRTYPMNSLAAALIGFVAPDGHGVSGLEHQCNAWLTGSNGIKSIIRDARRKAFWLAEGGYRPPRDGFHLILTIDAEIQATVERELAVSVEKYHAESGVAIVMHPKTGAILAMANVPGFDPNRYSDYGANRYRNRAITDPFEPGSTFKPFIAAAALAEKVVRLGEGFDCENGAWTDGVRTLHDHHPYGLLSFEDVVIKSSNVGMAKIGKRLGNKKLYDYVKAFGFGRKTGIDLEGEDPGILQSFNRWGPFSTTSIPIGQEIGATPLQMARAFCAFANGGLLVQPYVVRAVVTPDGRLVSDFSNPPSEGRALPEAVANTMRDRILCGVVEQGTGSKSRLAHYQVFGKTGTAQIARKGGGGYEPDAYVGSFVAAAPAADPQLVVFVGISRPKKSIGYYGGTVAAPVVKEILTHALAYLQIPPDRADAPTPTITALGEDHD